MIGGNSPISNSMSDNVPAQHDQGIPLLQSNWLARLPPIAAKIF
jgi:hypothetical protein